MLRATQSALRKCSGLASSGWNARLTFIVLILCSVSSAGALGLFRLPWSRLICAVCWLVLAQLCSPATVSWRRRQAVLFVAPLGLTLAVLWLHPYLASLLLAGWFSLLSRRSAVNYNWVLQHFSRAIVLFEVVDLVLLKHSIVQLWFSDILHEYTRIIRQALGHGEIGAFAQADGPLLVFTLVATMPLTGGGAGRYVLPLFQTLLIVGLLPLQVYVGAESIAFLALLSGCGFVCATPPLTATSSPAGRRKLTPPYRWAVIAMRIGGMAYIVAMLASEGVLALVDAHGKVGAAQNAVRSRILFVNDCAGSEGDDLDMTHFAPRAKGGAAAGPIPAKDFDRNRAQPRYDRLVRHLLPALGFSPTVRPLEDIDPNEYAQYRLVVLICLQHSLPDAHRDAIYECVASGATNVLVAGDHTDIRGVREPFNRLMAPLGVDLNYDSAYPFGPWDSQLTYNLHPVNGDRALMPIGAAGDPGVSVGGSLSLDKRVSWPLLTAADGFADEGTPDAPMYAGLGDRQFTDNEMRGGIVLAAERPLGRGTFLAFGDTAFLQNASLSRNFAYVSSVFRYLMRARSHSYAAARNLTSLCGGCLMVASLALRFSTLYGIACVSVCAGCALATSTLKGDIATLEELRCPLLVIDNGHGETFQSHVEEKGINIVIDVLNEHECNFTVLADAFRILHSDRVKGIMLLAPLGSLSSREERDLLAYVSRGGRLAYASGYYEAAAHGKWLERVGCRISPLILGGGQQVTVTSSAETAAPRIIETWAMELSHEWTHELTCFEKPVAAGRRLGSGRVFVLADSFALLDGAMGLGMATVNADSYTFFASALCRLFRG